MSGEHAGSTRREAVAQILASVKAWAPAARHAHSLLSQGSDQIEVRGDDPESFLAIIADSDETLIMAGNRARFELGPVPDDLSECLLIIQGILEGRLVEFIGRRSSKFELYLNDGRVLRSSVVDGLRPSWGESRRRAVPFAGN